MNTKQIPKKTTAAIPTIEIINVFLKIGFIKVSGYSINTTPAITNNKAPIKSTIILVLLNGISIVLLIITFF